MSESERNLPQQDFQDPLENFEPATYDDALQRALIEEPVAAIAHTPFAAVGPETPVRDAILRLAGLDVACLMIADEAGKLCGVLSDRDLLDKVALEYDRVKDLPVREVMTADPIFVNASDSSAAALTVMAVSGYRHVPVVDVEGRICGIVSPQRVTAFLQKYFE